MDLLRALMALLRPKAAPIGAAPAQQPPTSQADPVVAGETGPELLIPPPPAQGSASKPAVGKKGKAAIAAAIAATLAVEGGYVNNRNDPGGETNMGVTKRVAVAHGYTGPMRTMPRGVATSIYYQDYIVKPGYLPLAEIDAPVMSELFDTAVNMGSTRPSRWFQQSINAICGARLTIDGKVGAGTIDAYRTCQPRLGATKLCVTMLNSLDDKQAAEYRRLVSVNPNLRGFLKGWLKNRINNVDRRECATSGA